MYINITLLSYETVGDNSSKKAGSAPGTIDAGKEAAIEAEVRAARERATVPLELRVKSFREMLAEKEVCLTIILNYTYFFY